MPNNEIIKIDKLESSLLESIGSKDLNEINTDLYEAIFDSTLVDGILKEIPVIKTLTSFVKIGISVRDHSLIKKILKFLSEIKDISLDERIKFKEEIENFQESKKFGEIIITLLDRLDQNEKTKILANLIKSRVDEKIDLVQFFRLSNIVERAFIFDLFELDKYLSEPINQDYISDHLLSLGLISVGVIDAGDASGENGGFKYLINNLGLDMLNYGLNKKED